MATPEQRVGTDASCRYGCQHEERWEDVVEMKADLRQIKEFLIGSATGTQSVDMRLTIVERDMEEGRKATSLWRNTAAALMVGVFTPLLVWVGSVEFRDHVNHSTPITVVASPSPSALPVVASSPNHSQVPHRWMPSVATDLVPLPQPSSYVETLR